MNDYRSDITSNATPEQLARVLELARKQYRLAIEINTAEASLDAKKEELRRVSEVDLPDAMRAADVSEQPLGGGWLARLQVDVLGNISLKAEAKTPEDQARKDQALAWLEKNHPDIIKRFVGIFFPKEEQAWFKKFMRDIARRKRPLNAKANFYVEPQTLAAFIREQVANDPIFPKETFGVYERTRVELVQPTNQPKGKGK